MKTKKYIKLNAQQKLRLIKRYNNGESIFSLCKEAGISRTIFYRWLKSYKENQLEAEEVASLERKSKKKHWRKQNIKKEREVIRIWLNNPNLSIRQVASSASVSLGGAWNILRNYKKKVESKGKKTIKRYVKKSYLLLSDTQKFSLIKRYYEGDPIAKIAKEEGVSRTIFYRWLREYGNKNNEEVFRKKHRKGIAHWRFKPEIQDLAVEIAIEYPQFSLSEIASEIKKKGYSISRSGLFYILKRLNLGTFDKRINYAFSHGLLTAEPDLPSKQSLAMQFSTSIGQFGAFILILVFATIGVFISINKPIVVTPNEKVSTNINEQKPHRQEEKSYIAEKSQDQDFGWGALAVNTPGASIDPTESSIVGFGVVDHAGNTICNADIEFKITTNDAKKIISKEKAMGSGECGLQTVTNKPDYLAQIPSLGQTGEYRLEISASTYEGEKNFIRELIVQNNQDFEIIRKSYPTRVFPARTYPVRIEIMANKDFEGTISDVLPKGVRASVVSGQGIVYEKVKEAEQAIKWKVKLKKGEVYTFSYTLSFPQIWPEFYEIGPISFTDSKTVKIVYSEKRFWQIVADAL